MGMFDDVNYECTCPMCHAKVSGFQSKSGDCTLDTVEPTEVSNFYAPCSKCGCWIDFTAKKITNFTRTVTGKDDKCLHEHTKDVNV
jgi:hypothetical protein